MARIMVKVAYNSQNQGSMHNKQKVWCVLETSDTEHRKEWVKPKIKTGSTNQ